MLFKFRKKNNDKLKKIDFPVDKKEQKLNESNVWHNKKENDVFNNKLHLSAFSGILGLPSNLIKHNKNYSLSYESNKIFGSSKLKEISTFITQDFLNYKDVGVTNEATVKEEKDSILAGGDLLYKGKFYRYYTGFNESDIDFDPENTMTYTLVAEFDPETSQIKKETKKVLFKMDRYKQTPVSRNPKCYYINGSFYIILGIQNYNSQGALAVYKSDFPDRDFKYEGEITFNDQLLFWDAYFFVSPVYFKLNDKDVFLFSTVGKTKFVDENTMNPNSTYFVIGKLDFKKLTFDVEKIQKVDEGFDFYGSRIFENDTDFVMFSLISNSNADDELAIENGWMNNLSLPRILSYKDKSIFQNVHPNIYKLRKVYSAIENEMSFANRLQNIIVNNFNDKFEEKDFEIEFFNDEGKKFIIKWEKGEFSVDKSRSLFVVGKEFGQVWTKKIPRIHFLEIFLDNSVIEIFINHGEYTFTSKYYIPGLLKAKFTNLKGGAAFELNPINVEWRKTKTALISGEIIVDENQKILGSTYNIVERLAEKKHNIVKLLTTIGENQKADVIKKELDNLNVSTLNLITNPDKRHSWHDFVLNSDETILSTNQLERINFNTFVLASSESLLSTKSFESYQEIIKEVKLRHKPFIYRPNLNSFVLSKLKNLTKETVLLPRVKSLIDESWLTILDQSELLTLSETNDVDEAIKKTLAEQKADNILVVTDNKLYLLSKNNHYNTLILPELTDFARERLIDRSSGLLIHGIMRIEESELNRVELWQWIQKTFKLVAFCEKFKSKTTELENLNSEHLNLLLTKDEYDIFELEPEPEISEINEEILEIIDEPKDEIVDEFTESEDVTEFVETIEVDEDEVIEQEHMSESINSINEEEVIETIEVDKGEVIETTETLEEDKTSIPEEDDCHFYVTLEELQNQTIDCGCEEKNKNLK
ncbi:GH32 C-terminal domain-containing protein [Mesomycoplasma neurolyticum]|uniref:beta-fructofuranosidase n=1 Tax=Mesomycoplasma neurolyticum TaxID=2120 RepID=A0A449A4E1_9BACT|nr:GH32 C-terminal domain-containing protein [Mesomycoplasma neurolyticum]VEU59150.1 Sucrose-6-phosphate hydrolase [Mesomycoplasma neurolyticum]